MVWLVFLPLTLFILLAIAGFAMMLLVERDERQRSIRHAPKPRRVFRPVLIQGGKLHPPAKEAADKSKIA